MSMKNLKLYEDLIKDLHGLGITKDRISIDVILKERNNKEGEKIITIHFTKLTREGKIEFKDIINSIMNEEFEIEVLHNLQYSSIDKYKKNIYQYLLKIATKQREKQWDPEEFLKELCEYWGSSVEAELKDYVKIIATGNNYHL